MPCKRGPKKVSLSFSEFKAKLKLFYEAVSACNASPTSATATAMPFLQIKIRPRPPLPPSERQRAAVAMWRRSQKGSAHLASPMSVYVLVSMPICQTVLLFDEHQVSISKKGQVKGFSTMEIENREKMVSLVRRPLKNTGHQTVRKGLDSCSNLLACFHFFR